MNQPAFGLLILLKGVMALVLVEVANSSVSSLQHANVQFLKGVKETLSRNRTGPVSLKASFYNFPLYQCFSAN